MGELKEEKGREGATKPRTILSHQMRPFLQPIHTREIDGVLILQHVRHEEDWDNTVVKSCGLLS
jgi:hypothetical protein